MEGARDSFVRIQKANGGFGYLERTTGDTSQVQYAMWPHWSMHNAGIRTPVPNTEAAIRYLMATQDPVVRGDIKGSWAIAT